MTVLSILGIIAAIALLMILGSKGWNLIFITLLSGAIVAATSGLNPLELLSTNYFAGFGGSVQAYFLMMITSAVFGALMSGTGAATSIARTCMKLVRHARPEQQRFWTIVVITLITFVLGYGGINNFVIMFTLVGISKEFCKEADLPWHLALLSTISSGFLVQGFLPGSPSIQNLLPIEILGTSATAGVGLGLICSLCGVVLWILYVQHELKRCKDDHFLPSGAEIDKTMQGLNQEDECPNIFLALLPSICMLVALNVAKLSPVASMLIGCAVALILFWKKIGGLNAVVKLITSGIENGGNATLLLAACVGFGSIVSASVGYSAIIAAMSNLSGPIYWQWLIAIAVSCAACGSGSGGLSIGLNSLSARFVEMGANPAVLHRLGTMACCTLDTLPQNSTVFNTVAVYKLDFKTAYKHIFVICCGITTICAVIGVLLASIGIV